MTHGRWLPSLIFALGRLERRSQPSGSTSRSGTSGPTTITATEFVDRVDLHGPSLEPGLSGAAHLVPAPADLHVAPTTGAVATPIEIQPATARALLDQRTIPHEKEFVGHDERTIGTGLTPRRMILDRSATLTRHHSGSLRPGEHAVGGQIVVHWSESGVDGVGEVKTQVAADKVQCCDASCRLRSDSTLLAWLS